MPIIRNYRNWKKLNESDDEDSSYLDDILGDLYDLKDELTLNQWKDGLSEHQPYLVWGEEYDIDNGTSVGFELDPNVHGLHDIEWTIEFSEEPGNNYKVSAISMNSRHTSPDFTMDEGVDMDDEEWEEAEQEARDDHDGVTYEFYWTAQMPKTVEELNRIINDVRPQPYVSLPSGKMDDYDMPEGWE
jgi:hypothetical protein